MNTYYRKAYDIRAYTFHAAVYCQACGESLPGIDPEGEERGAVFVSDDIDTSWACNQCGDVIR